MDLDPRLLRYFLAVAEHLNFNRAAERIRVSQPSLSVAIRKFERQLGFELFERNANKISLTAHGRRLMPVARDLSERNQAAAAFIREMAHGEPPVLRVGYSPFLDTSFIASLRSGFVQQTGLEMQLISCSTAGQYEKLLKGTLHAGFVIPLRQDELITTEAVHRERFFIALPRGHELETFKSLSLTQIMAEPVVWFARDVNSVLYDRFRATCREAGYGVKVVQEVTGMLECLQFVALGVGISFSTRAVADLQPNGVSFRELNDDRFYVETALAYRHDNEMKTVKRFIDYVRASQQDQLAQLASAYSFELTNLSAAIHERSPASVEAKPGVIADRQP